MKQNKTDKNTIAKAAAPADNRASVKPQFILDNREFLHLAVRRSVLLNVVFVLMCCKDNPLDIFVEQRTFKKQDDADDYICSVRGMIAANYASQTWHMDALAPQIKRFNEAMEKLKDMEFWNNPHTK